MRMQGFKVGLIAVLFLLAPGIGGAAGTRHTLSSQLPYWSNNGINGPTNECETDDNPVAGGLGGFICYERSVSVPNSDNTLLVDVSAIGHSDDNYEHEFEAVTLDGVACISGSSGEFSTDLQKTGWLLIQDNQDEEQPLASSYQWCCKAGPGSHTVDVKIAAFPGNNEVEFDQANVTIDSGFYPPGARCDFVSDF